MELEELKNIWKNNGPDYTPKGEEELTSMLKGSSHSIVTKLKRIVWIELLITVAVILGLFIYAFTLPSGAMKWHYMSMLLMLVACMFYYVKKLMMLNRFDSTDENIRTNLEKLTTNLSSYLKIYKRSYAILYPVYFFLGLLFGFIERGADEFLQLLKQPRTILFLTGTAIVFYFCSTWLASWYIKKLYGNRLEKLKGLLNELKSDPSVSL